MHNIEYAECDNKDLKKTLRWIERHAYDPLETCGYHGNMTVHDIICKDYNEAMRMIKKWDTGWYSDHAVRYKNGRKYTWLIKYEWHC